MSRTNFKVFAVRTDERGTCAGQGGTRGGRTGPYEIQELVSCNVFNSTPTSLPWNASRGSRGGGKLKTVRTTACREVAAARKAEQAATKTLSAAARTAVVASNAAARTAAAGKRTAAAAATIKAAGGSKVAAAEVRAAAEGLRAAAAGARAAAAKARAAAARARSAVAEAKTTIAAQRGRGRGRTSTVRGRKDKMDFELALPGGGKVHVYGPDLHIFPQDGQH